MVYPSSLPGNAPFALNVKMADLYASSHDEAGKTIVHNDFQFPQEANLFAAGTLGNSFSFFSEVTYEENPDGSGAVELEHVRLDLVSAFGPEHLFNFRIGKLAPNLYDGFQEMWLMTDNGVDTLFTYNPIGFNGRNRSRGRGRRSRPARANAGHRDVRRGGTPSLLHGRAFHLRSGREGRTASSTTAAARTSTRASTTSSGASGSTGTRPE